MTDYPNNTSSHQSFLDEDERKRCCDEAGAGDDNSTDRGCVDDWKRKRDKARLCSEEALACLQSAKDQHSSAASWEAKLKKWKEDAEEAHKKAVETYNGSDSFLVAVARTKTGQTTIATEAVLCLVKSIFERVSTLLFVSTSAEDELGQIQTLKQRIECDDKLDTERKNKALDCIKPFEEKVKAVQSMESDLLQRLLKIAHSAKQVAAAVDYPGSGAGENLGIKWQLEDLKRRISGQTLYTKRERKCGKQQDPAATETGCCDKISLDPPCGSDIIFPKKAYFPIREMEGVKNSKNSDYYDDIAGLYDKAKVSAEKAKAGVEKSTKISEEAQAYYSGLKDAIKAIEDAKTA